MPKWMFTSANCDAYLSSDAVTFANGQTVDGAALDAVLGGTAGAEFGDALCAGFANVSANATGLNATGLNATGANATTAAPSAVDGRRLGGRRRLASCAYDAGEDAEAFSLDIDADAAALGGDDDADDDAASSGGAAAEAAYASYALAYLENLTAVPDEPGDDDDDGGGDDGATAEAGLCLSLATAAAAPTAAPSLDWAASCGEPLYDLDLDGGDVLANNLGGRGPGNGTSETLRYGSVTYKDGRAVDLVLSVAPGSTYAVADDFADYQGRAGAFGQVNVRDNSTASLVFSFVDAATSAPVELERFYVTFFDVDRQKKATRHSERLCVDADAVDGYVLGEPSELAVARGGEACDGSAPAREKSARFPSSKAPLSAVVRSFRPMFGRAIISRRGLDAWMRVPERARAARSRSKRRRISLVPPRSPGASLTFAATAAGFACDNPSDPHALGNVSCADCDQCAASGGAQGSKRERNSQLQRLVSRPFSTRFG